MTSNPTDERRRGVFLLPNLLTTGALFAGFFAIVAGIDGQWVAAVVAVIVAGVLDGLDGRVARLTNTQSDFGTQYDSLADLVSFGLAPALLAYNWSLSSLAASGPVAAKLGWLAAFIYVACGALRLARYNAQAAVADKRYFQGLASPAAAGMLVSTVWFCVDRGISGTAVRWLVLFETVALGLLMFSRVRYWSFKTLPMTDRIPIAWILAMVLLLALLAVDPPGVLVAIGLAYVTSGLVMTIRGRRDRQELRHRRGRQLCRERARRQARPRSLAPPEPPPVTKADPPAPDGDEDRGTAS